MARTRTTKKLAQRIDLNYFKRPTPRKRAKLWLSLAIPVLALFWIAERTFSRDSRVYSSGRLSEAHAILEKECSTCHIQQADVFSAKSSNSACLACHDGPSHHAAKTVPPDCAACHTEHRGRISLTAASNQACATCHANLNSANGGQPHYAQRIRSFENGHPQFAAVSDAGDPSTIKLNHAIHMRPIRRGPNGPDVQLECGDCHRPAASDSSWHYADARYVAATTSYSGNDDHPFAMMGKEKSLAPRVPASGRERMAPVKFATACAACHALNFDKRFDEGVPHDKPEVVHAFVVKKFSEYIAAHPNELREMQDPERDLTGKPLPPRTRTLTPAQWAVEHTAVAEELLWHKTCAQCHMLTGAQLQTAEAGRWTAASSPQNPLRSLQNGESLPQFAAALSPLPQVAPANITTRWMPHAKFDHDAHRSFTCTGCHQKALNSTESSDILLPGIAVCQTCHAPGADHAESRCFECHTYHDWSKRKEITPTFALSGLQNGGM